MRNKLNFFGHSYYKKLRLVVFLSAGRKRDLGFRSGCLSRFDPQLTDFCESIWATNIVFFGMFRQKFLIAILLSCLLSGCEPADGQYRPPQRLASGWSQWGGSDRSFQIDLAPGGTSFKELWSRKHGNGQAAVISDGELGFSVFNQGDQDHVQSWRVDSGEIVWQSKYDVAYHSFRDDYDGPHSTPLLTNRLLITVSIDANVIAMDRKTGEIVWRRNLQKDFGTKLPQSGYASSPILVGDNIVVPTLGLGHPGAVALDAATGKTVWESYDFESSHASPIVIEHASQTHLVFHGMYDLVGLDPASGKRLWEQPLRTEAADNITFTPLWDSENKQILIAHGYCDFGAQAIKIFADGGNWKSKVQWTNRLIRTVHTNGVLHRGMMIASTRDPGKLLTGIRLVDGKTVFRQRGYGKANVLASENELILLDEGGDLIVGEIQEDKFVEQGRQNVLKSNAWTVPSIAGNVLLVRDRFSLAAIQITPDGLP